MASRSLVEVVPDMVRRATLSVPLSTPLYFVGTILGERAVESVAIVRDSTLVGELRFLELLKFVYALRDSERTPQHLLEIDARKAMSTQPNKLKAEATISDFLRKCAVARTGVLFITTPDDTLVGHVTLMDLLRWLAAGGLDVKVRCRDIGSKRLVAVPPTATMSEIVETMLDHYVRRVTVKDETGRLTGGIDDRDLVGWIFSSSSLHESFRDLFSAPVGPRASCLTVTEKDIELPEAARRLVVHDRRCLLLDEDALVTPWDIVIKGLRKVGL